MSETQPLLTAQQQRASQEGAMHLYREIAVGDGGWGRLILQECITGSGSLLPGLLGLGFRTIVYPMLFSSCGARPYIGPRVTLRNPGGMTFGSKVMIDEGVTLDCRKGSSLVLGDACAVGKGSIVSAKGGEITLGRGVNIGSLCRIATQSGIAIGESTLIAAYCYIGPGNHRWDEENQSYMTGEMDLQGGVTIGSNVWIGARATILDGVTVGDGAMVGAHSLVREDVPSGAIVAGCPAKKIGEIGENRD